MKEEIRILGIDDSPFEKFKKGSNLVIGVLFRGGNFMDGVMSTKIKVDGDDSTGKLIKMIKKSKFKSQIRCIALNGIAMGGFNVVDVNELNKRTKIPVIVIIRDYPDFKKIFAALRKIKRESKVKLIKKAGDVVKIGKIYVQLAGLNLDKARQILKISCTHSFIPEPLRVAHLIAAGIAMGESKGRA
ncbi:DUF99 family protein [Candidatus Woesearchaeota archaeon]|nr:DUF99 family protein [Candidatus Woesearchaeota archaeon]